MKGNKNDKRHFRKNKMNKRWNNPKIDSMVDKRIGSRMIVFISNDMNHTNP